MAFCIFTIICKYTKRHISWLDGLKPILRLPSVWEQLPDKVMFLNSLKIKAGLNPNHFSDSFEGSRMGFSPSMPHACDLILVGKCVCSVSNPAPVVHAHYTTARIIEEGWKMNY